MLKKQLLKKLAITGAVVMGMLTFGGVTQANAATASPSYGHFTSRTITYHINGSSKHWKKVWAKAIHKFDHNGTIKLKATSKKKAKMTMSTVVKFKGKDATLPYKGSGSGSKKVIKKMHLRLSQKVSGKQVYIEKDNLVVSGTDLEVKYATAVIAFGLGLNESNNIKGSMMNWNEWHANLSSGDKLGLAQAYAHVK